MSYHDVVFPEGVSYGSSGGPAFATAVFETESGAEERVARRSRPRYEYNAAMGVKTPAQFAEVEAFFLARKGRANSFKYKDWRDYHSNPASGGHDAAAGVKDQTIGVGDGARTVFQLQKTYTSGPTSYVRSVSRPKSGTVRVWVGATELTIGSGFTVDYQTGAVTLASAPADGAIVYASFEFWVHVRFDDDRLNVRVDTFGTASAGLPLIEVTDDLPANVAEYFYGGSSERSFAVSSSIDTSARFWVLSASATGLSVSLPPPTDIPTGGPVFYVRNAGTNSFTLKDNSGTTLATLTAGTGVEVLLTKTTGGSKVWCAQ